MKGESFPSRLTQMVLSQSQFCSLGKPERSVQIIVLLIRKKGDVKKKVALKPLPVNTANSRGLFSHAKKGVQIYVSITLFA